MPGDTFEEHFGRAPTVVATAPGRVNLIGDHTDYNGGYVLPMPIPQHATFALAPRRDQQVHVHTAQLGQSASYRLGEERSGRGWIDYVQGLTWLLGREGHRLGGFDALLTSDVPAGAGLSSSAALEVALARALRELFGLGIDDVALALLSRRVETEFVGAPIGIMDQMASSLGEQGSALFLDTHCMRWERVPLPKDVEVVVIASGVTHSHAGGDYRLRRHECDEAARLLGVKLLRELEHEPERVQRL
ncbi:MAG: galactokinase, partial [Myxococcales bacterium]